MKKLLIMLLALSLVFAAVFTLVACDDASDNGGKTNDNNSNNSGDNGDGADDKVAYTVNVVDQNGNGVAGVPVTLEVGPATKYDITTDSNGVATQMMKETNLPIYAILGTSLPEGYGDGDEIEVAFAAGAKSATLEVVKQVAYKVSFVDSEGNGISGVLAQVCVGDTCMTGKTSGETGVLVFYVNPGSENVSMQINTIPDEYAQDKAGTKQYYEENSFELVIVLADAV